MDMNELTDNEKLRDYILDELLPEYIPFKTERSPDTADAWPIVLPEIDCKLTLEVPEMSSVHVMLQVSVFSSRYNKIYWCGNRQYGNDAVSAARKTLEHTRTVFFSGLERMFGDKEGILEETEFNGKRHKWKIYTGDVVKFQNRSVGTETRDVFLPHIMPELKRRLGNQRTASLMTLVVRDKMQKISLVQFDGMQIDDMCDIIGNRTYSPDPGDEILMNQYVFIVQDEETYIPSIYDGKEGLYKQYELVQDFMNRVKYYSRLTFDDEFLDKAERSMGDPILLAACHRFLPELCVLKTPAIRVEHFSDIVEVCTSDGKIHEVSLMQLMDFEQLKFMLELILKKKTFGNSLTEIWSRLSYSGAIARYLKFDERERKFVADLRGVKLRFVMREG